MMRENAEQNRLTDLAEEYSEIGADKLVEESKHFLPFLDHLGSEIPYVKTAVAAIKFPRTLSDYLLGRKVQAFLYGGNIDEAKVKKFKEKFSKAKQERLWEQIVFSINNHDNKIKSEILGKLFTALTDDFITEEEFFVMVHATNSLNIRTLDDLKRLYSLGSDTTLAASLYYSFATLGLVDIDNSGIGTLGGGSQSYPLNQIGWKYVGIVFDYPETIIKGQHIGREPLVAELDKEGRLSNRAYPLSHLQKEGIRYREVNLFIVNKTGQVLCDDDDFPVAILSEVVLAGRTPQNTADELAEEVESEFKPLGVSNRNMEDTPVQIWAYIVQDENAPKYTHFIDILRSREAITSFKEKSDQLRYLNDVATQIERHLKGELAEIWNDHNRKK